LTFGKRGGDFPGVFGNGAKRLLPIQMLTSGDEPRFQRVQIGHCSIPHLARCPASAFESAAGFNDNISQPAFARFRRLPGSRSCTASFFFVSSFTRNSWKRLPITVNRV